MKELIAIQGELKAPKNQLNKFGGYHYRSAEDILEAVKPHLLKHDCILTISDTVEMLGGRFYVKATARLMNSAGEVIETTAYAREEESKKGMDSSQITGATSSYARKYALNGLFCIDDTKDADATNTHGAEEKKPAQPQNSQAPQSNDDPSIDAMVLDIMSASNLDEITKKWNLYKKYDANKEITAAVRARRQELGV